MTARNALRGRFASLATQPNSLEPSGTVARSEQVVKALPTPAAQLQAFDVRDITERVVVLAGELSIPPHHLRSVHDGTARFA